MAKHDQHVLHACALMLSTPAARHKDANRLCVQWVDLNGGNSMGGR